MFSILCCISNQRKKTESIKQTFNREGSLYLACNEKNALVTFEQPLNNISCGRVKKEMSSVILQQEGKMALNRSP